MALRWLWVALLPPPPFDVGGWNSGNTATSPCSSLRCLPTFCSPGAQLSTLMTINGVWRLPCLSAFCPPRSICHFPSAIPSEPGLHCPSAFCPPGFCHLRSAIGYGRPVSLAFRRSALPASAICDRLLSMAAPSPLPFGVLPSRLLPFAIGYCLWRPRLPCLSAFCPPGFCHLRSAIVYGGPVSLAFRRSARPASAICDRLLSMAAPSPLPFGVLPARLLPFAIGDWLWRPRLPCLSAFCPPGFCHLRSAIVYGGPVSLAFRRSARPASAICDRLLSMAAPSPLPFGVLPARLLPFAIGYWLWRPRLPCLSAFCPPGSNSRTIIPASRFECLHCLSAFCPPGSRLGQLAPS